MTSKQPERFFAKRRVNNALTDNIAVAIPPSQSVFTRR
jgi:hypothetical protein